MGKTDKADMATEKIVRNLNLLIAADKLTGYALTVRAPGEQEAMYGSGSIKRGDDEMLVWAAKFIAAIVKRSGRHPDKVAAEVAKVVEVDLKAQWKHECEIARTFGYPPPPPPFYDYDPPEEW